LFFEALALHQRAVQEKDLKQFNQVRALYGKLLELQPGHVPAMNNLAWLLLRQFDAPTEALGVVEQLRIAVSADRMTPDLLDTVIESYARSGRRAEAFDLAAKSVGKFPNSGILLLQYGAALLEEAGDDPGRRASARKYLERARAEGIPPNRQSDLTALLARLNPSQSEK